MSQIKERPILFSGAMVRALLDGSKTQTRRIVKDQPDTGSGIEIMHNGTSFAAYDLTDWLTDNYQGYGFQDEDQLWRCPYGQPGERLWVRESWKVTHASWCTYPSGQIAVQYLADAAETSFQREDAEKLVMKAGKGQPSIFMPRWASRLLLEVVSVRVERLQAISEADAVAEGIEPYDLPGVYKLYGSECSRPIGSVAAIRTDYVQPIKSYESLWELINGPGSWALNPWVWVVEFKVIEPAA